MTTVATTIVAPRLRATLGSPVSSALSLPFPASHIPLHPPIEFADG